MQAARAFDRHRPYGDQPAVAVQGQAPELAAAGLGDEAPGGLGPLTGLPDIEARAAPDELVPLCRKRKLAGRAKRIVLHCSVVELRRVLLAVESRQVVVDPELAL